MVKKNTIGRIVARIFALSLILQGCTSIQKKEFAASVRITNENYDEAIPILNEILVVNPQNKWALLKRSMCYSFLENYVEAEKDISKLIELYPKNAEYFFHRGEILYEGGAYSESISDVQKALHLTANRKLRSYCYYLLANAEFEQKNYLAAIRACTDYLKYGQHENAYILRGHAYFQLKDYSDALHDYNTALSVAKKNRRHITNNLFYYNKGRSELACGLYKEASVDFKRLNDEFYKTKEYRELCEQKIKECK